MDAMHACRSTLNRIPVHHRAYTLTQIVGKINYKFFCGRKQKYMEEAFTHSWWVGNSTFQLFYLKSIYILYLLYIETQLSTVQLQLNSACETESLQVKPFQHF